MKIRLMGTADELAAAVPVLRDAFDVHEVSDFYPNRGTSKLGRVYVEAAPLTAQGTVRAHAVRADRAEIASNRRELKQ